MNPTYNETVAHLSRIFDVPRYLIDPLTNPPPFKRLRLFRWLPDR